MPSGPTAGGQLRPNAAVAKGAVWLDIKGSQALTEGFTDNERAPIRRDHNAIGEGQVVGHHGGLTIGGNQGDHAGIDGLSGWVYKIIANVSHVEAALGIHNAVAQAEGGEAAEVSQRL